MPTFEEYTKTLKTFYIKIIKDHSNMIKLSRNFTQMIQDLSKNQNTLIISRLSKRKSQLSVSGLSNASNSKSVKSLRSLTNIKSNKGQTIYDNNDFKKVILFSYLHHVITISNTDIFNMIQTKSKLLIDAIQQNKILDKVKWQRCAKQWKKVMQLMSHKTKVRWQKILANSVTLFQNDFMQVILRSVMSSSSNIQNLFNNPIQNMDQISTQLKISICYFQYYKGQILNKKQSGEFKYHLKIGYIKSQNTYAFYQKMPTQKIQSSQQTKNQIKIDKNQIGDKNFLTIDTKTIRNLGIDINKSTPSPIKKDQDTKSRKSYQQNSGHQKSSKSNQIGDQKSQKSISQTSKRRPGLPSNLIKKKNLRVIQALLRQYNSNSLKFTDLQCFLNQQNKDTKIKKMLESRKKIQLQ